MPGYKPIVLTRGCEVSEIPSGRRGLLPEGAMVRVLQALGGSYTLLTPTGEMVRLAAEDRDALGEDVPAPEAGAPPPREGPFSERAIWATLMTVYDPEIPVNIVDLGLVYHCGVRELPDGGRRVEVKMAMTAPGCGMGDILREEARQKLLGVPGVTEAEVEIVWDPPWDRSRMSEAAMLQLGWL